MHLISSRIHTYVGLGVGLLLVVAPWLLDFDERFAPRAVAVAVGLVVVLGELVTTSPSSPLKIVPAREHTAVDVVTGAFLAVSPWVFGFADLAASAWVPHVVVGLLIAVHALVTDSSDTVVAADAGGVARR